MESLATVETRANARRPCADLPGLATEPINIDRSTAGCGHAISVDVEDWQQSVFDHSLPVSQRFVTGTRRILDLLDKTGTRATFFVLGNVAVKVPDLIRELAACGHEIQTHGYDHTEIHTMTPEAFRRDLLRAKGTLEDILGSEIVGYRAPRFSIDRKTIWALDVLAECGFRYDSSIFPMRIRGYGIAGWPLEPVRVRTSLGNGITEVPVTVGKTLNRHFPLGGGGYFRLLPSRIIIAQIKRLDKSRTPSILYCHPHEFDPEAFAELPFKVPVTRRIHQGLGRRSFARKLESLLGEFSFGPIGDLLAKTAGF